MKDTMHTLLDLALASDLDHSRSSVVLTHRWSGLRRSTRTSA
jgi:hypothetical protein